MDIPSQPPRKVCLVLSPPGFLEMAHLTCLPAFGPFPEGSGRSWDLSRNGKRLSTGPVSGLVGEW